MTIKKLFRLKLPNDEEILLPPKLLTNKEVYEYIQGYLNERLILIYNCIPILQDPIINLMNIGYDPYEYLVIKPFTTKMIKFELLKYKYIFSEEVHSYQTVFNVKQILSQRFCTVFQNIKIMNSSQILSNDQIISELGDYFTIDVIDGYSIYHIYFNSFFYICLPKNSTLKNLKTTLAGYNQLFEKGIRYGPYLTDVLNGVQNPDDSQIDQIECSFFDFKYQTSNIKMFALISIENDKKSLYRYQGQYPHFPLKNIQPEDVVNPTKCFLEKQTQIERNSLTYIEKLTFSSENSITVKIDNEPKNFVSTTTIKDLKEIYGKNVGIVINNQFVTEESDFLVKYVGNSTSDETNIILMKPKNESRLCEFEPILSDLKKGKPFSRIIPVNLTFSEINSIFLSDDEIPSQFFSIEDSKKPIEKSSKLESCTFDHFRTIVQKELEITYRFENEEKDDTVTLNFSNHLKIKDFLLQVSKKNNKPFHTYRAFIGKSEIDIFEPVVKFINEVINIKTDLYQPEIESESDKFLNIYNDVKNNFVTFKNNINEATVESIIKAIKQQEKLNCNLSLYLNFHLLSNEDKPIVLCQKSDNLFISENVKKQTFFVSNGYGITKSLSVPQNCFNVLSSLILNDFSLNYVKVHFLLKPIDENEWPFQKVQYELPPDFDGGSLPKNSKIELEYELKETDEFTFSYNGEKRSIKLNEPKSAIHLHKKILLKKLKIFDLHYKAAEFMFSGVKLDESNSFSSFGIPSKAPIEIVQCENPVKITVCLLDGQKIGDYYFRNEVEQSLVKEIVNQLKIQFDIEEENYELEIYKDNKGKNSLLDPTEQIKKNETVYASFEKANCSF
ncbi:hypothetical protein M9Y10_017509 [Tritrichomonas musculus]|uniref:Ubiquitin-like domain-containing protein n=1 Tax=Tritrichomonas musculus TaxID=1915356 RepID=A0ABR2HTT2_9EUKA